MSRERKESGFFWLRDVPRTWHVVRGKDLFRKVSLPVRDEDEVVTCFRDGVTTLRKNRREDGFTFALKEAGYQGVRVGQLVIHAMDSFAGAIGISDSDGKCSPVYSVCAARNTNLTHLPYYSFVLRDMATIGYIQSVAKGIRERSTDFRYSEVEEAFFSLPPLIEQRSIAAWLALQAKRIDKRRELLGKKRELLRDLRQTLLDEEVSKGLTECEMVDTGQLALRNLPAHWSLSKFKRKVFFREGPGIMAADFTDTGVPLIRIGNVTPGLITMAGCNFVSPEKAERQWRQFRLKLGDLVISASASTGIVTEAGDEAVGSIPYTGLIILRPKAGLHKNFLRLFVISKAFLAQVEDFLKGSTIHHFGPTHLRQMLIPVPPMDEQEKIAAFLDRKLSQIDRQVALIDQLDELLQQQRKAIIHEAVTGKIDLSGEPVAQSPAMLEES